MRQLLPLSLLLVANAHQILTQLRADGFDVRDDDVARLSPFVRHHIIHGRYSFQVPDLPGGLRSLRDPDTDDDR